MNIAFITWNSHLVPLTEGLCRAQIHTDLNSHFLAKSNWRPRVVVGRAKEVDWLTLFDRKKPPPPRGGFLCTMFPNQEPGGRGAPSKHLVQIFRAGSSSSGSLIREHCSSEQKTLPGPILRSTVVLLCCKQSPCRNPTRTCLRIASVSFLRPPSGIERCRCISSTSRRGASCGVWSFWW